MYRRQPRRGVTLTEILVAIFVCGLGLMALMTLFPLGAFNMAQALEDDRSGYAGANGAAILRMVWRQACQTGGQSLTDPGGNDRFFVELQSMLERGPVYIDPIGIKAGAGGSLGGIPRTSLRCLRNGSLQDAWQWCALLDDIEFEPTGVPHFPVPRNIRYSWAWMVRPIAYPGQRPPYRALAFAVVVYQNRSMMGGAGNSEVPVGGSFINPYQISLGDGHSVRKNSWLIDVSNQPDSGHFYRVTRVEAGNVVTVQQPRRGTGGGNFIVLDNVVEVFERTTLE